jgi:hypothetical protein
MKKLSPIVLLLTLMMTGCVTECEKKKFEFDPSIKLNEVYVVTQSDNFSETADVYREEILDMIDIPEDAEIDEVNIESISLKLTLLEGNEATSVKISGGVLVGWEEPDLFNNVLIDLNTGEIPEVVINQLINEGMEAIKSKIENYLYGTDSGPFIIALIGYGEGYMHLNINLKIAGTVRYFVCEEVPFFIEADGPCDL